MAPTISAELILRPLRLVRQIVGVAIATGGLHRLLGDGIMSERSKGGFVTTSCVPQNEWNETLNKARGLLKAVELAQGQK